MSRFRGRGSLNLKKEYLFGFKTLVFATSGILSIHKRKENLKSHHFTLLNVQDKSDRIFIFG